MRRAPTRLHHSPRLRLCSRRVAAGLALRFRGTESAASSVLRTCLSPLHLDVPSPASSRSPVPSRKTFIIVGSLRHPYAGQRGSYRASSNYETDPRKLFAEKVRRIRHCDDGFARLGGSCRGTSHFPPIAGRAILTGDGYLCRTIGE